MFHSSRRDSGSTPTVGSSSSSSRGERTRVQASPSFCFMPPESRPASRSRKGARPVMRISAGQRSARCAADTPCRSAYRDRFSATERSSYRPKRWGMYPMADCTACASATVSRPSTARLPASGSSSPAARRSRVVLPAPSGPRRPLMVPGARSRVTPSTARTSLPAARKVRHSPRAENTGEGEVIGRLRPAPWGKLRPAPWGKQRRSRWPVVSRLSARAPRGPRAG